MAKLTLSDLSNLQNETTVTGTINANNDLIEAALENTLSRDGTTPNTMLADLDMNSYRIMNLPLPVNDSEPARLQDIGDAPGYAADAEASATAAAASATSAASSATTAASSATSATASASAASTSATSAATSATTSADNATVVVGNEYAFATSTTMADPSTGNLRFDNATIASAGNIAISALTNATGNPNIRTFIAAWDDSTNTNRGTLLIRKIGTPATFAVCTISGALTDNTTWLQLPITYVTGSGTFSASDRLSVQFTRAGDKGADGAGVGDVVGPSSSVDSEIALFNSTTGKLIKRASATGIATVTSGVLGVTGTSTTATLGTIELGHATDTTLSRSAAGQLAVEGGAGSAYVATIELGNASDTTLSRSSAGVLAVEGTTVSLNSTSAVHTASTIELGAASDTTLSRVSAGIIAVEGQTVPMLNTANPWTAHQYTAPVTITDQATLSWTVSTGQKGRVTLGGNRTMGTVTGAVEGATYVLIVVQDGTGSRTISWTTSGAGAFDFGAAGAPTLTTTASKVDILTFEAVSIGGTLKLRNTGIVRAFT